MLDKSEVRQWAINTDQDCPARGRLPQSVLVSYLRVNPSIARSLARDNSVEIGKRGRISLETIQEIASAI